MAKDDPRLTELRQPLIREDYELQAEDRVIERLLSTMAGRLKEIWLRRQAIEDELLRIDEQWREGEALRRRMGR